MSLRPDGSVELLNDTPNDNRVQALRRTKTPGIDLSAKSMIPALPDVCSWALIEHSRAVG